MSKTFHDIPYLDMVRHVLENGSAKTDRTGTGTISIFSHQMRFNLSDGSIPLLTTKKMFTRGVIHELLWYLQGNTNIKYLNDNGVNIWNEWSTSEGHLNKVYGFQWRKWEVDDWMSNVDEVPIKTGGVDSPFVPPQNEKLIPAEHPTDEYIGKRIQTWFGDYFTVISKSCSPGDKNSRYVVQFDDTTTITTVLRPALRVEKPKVRDPYRISIFGQGCLGVYDEYTPIRKVAYNLWYNMMRRCYDPLLPEYQFYGGRGVFVDQSWRCFSTFLRDIHDLVYFSKWAAEPSRYELDKDYFCATSYSKETCMFLPSKYNQVLPKLDGCKYTATNKHTNQTLEFTVQRWFATQHGIKHSQIISTALTSSPTQQTRDWIFKKIQPRAGYVFRQRVFVDQIQNVIDTLKTDPDSRRLLISAWNVADLEGMGLPPCHYAFQFYTRPLSQQERINICGMVNTKGQSSEQIERRLEELEVPHYQLSCMLNQRSCDVGLGVPFNIVQYSILTRMIAHVVGMAPGEFIWNGGDVHIYNNHIDALVEQITREPFPSPKLIFNREINNINDFMYDDFYIHGYECHPSIKMEVSV